MVNRTPRTFVWLVLGLAVCTVALGAARSTESKSVWAGVYTEAQARKGAELFTNVCANCHGDDLAGIEQAPALTGDSFGDKWNTKSLNKLFERLHQELPYHSTVETEAWKELRKGDIRIEQTIYVERESQRKIVLGKGGQTIKAIGEAARKEIAKIVEAKVHLFLFVKVREGWGDDPERYRAMGLEFPKD